MEKISRMVEALERLSKGLESGPGIAFLSIIITGIILLLVSALIVPRLKWKERTKNKFRRVSQIMVLAVYFAVILAFMLLLRDSASEYHVQVIPFSEFFAGSTGAEQIPSSFLKICLFIPVGILFTCQLQRQEKLICAMMFSFAMSLFLEFFQYIGKMGNFATGDMILNTLGGMLGSLCALEWKNTSGKKKAVGILLRVASVFCAAVVFLGVTAFGTYHVLRVNGEKQMKEKVSSVSLTMESKDKNNRSGDSGYIWHDGKAYRYNDDIITLLCMGIDKSSEETGTEKASGQNGQADTIFLTVMDPVHSQLKVIAVSRDTMTEIPAFDSKGNYVGENINHLGLAYAYGDGKEKSCQYMTDAVSKLFYGIPINGYAAFNLDTIGQLNDAVGGVTVTVPEDEDMSSANKALKSGAEVTLDGDMAETFVRWRNTDVHGSNNMRIARQKQFLLSFFQQAVNAVQKDVSLPVTLYQEFSKEMVTDIDLNKAVYLVSEVVKMSFDEGNLVILPGESRAGKVYDEFYVDDDALYELILDTFYIEETLS